MGPSRHSFQQNEGHAHFCTPTLVSWAADDAACVQRMPQNLATMRFQKGTELGLTWCLSGDLEVRESPFLFPASSLIAHPPVSYR